MKVQSIAEDNVKGCTPESYQTRARHLIECLPYMREFSGETIVIKYGGHAMTDDALKKSFALNVALLKYAGINPVIVHGGGPQIGKMLSRLDITSTFREGMRVTDDATMDVVEMVLVGKVNKEIVNLVSSTGAIAVGLSGEDGRLISAEKLEMVIEEENRPPEIIDLGRVGKVVGINTSLLETLNREEFIPIIAPIGVDKNNNTYNINADIVAAAVASALKARRLLLLTDVPGILTKEKELIRSVSTREIGALIANGTVHGGMIPKVNCATQAIEAGVGKVMIVDGRVENCILLELFTDVGIGTEIIKAKV